ncbi:MAG: GspE/PulE family protein [Candidatus Paceibacterota bacterium]
MAFVDYLIQKGIVDSQTGEDLLNDVAEAGSDAVDILVSRGQDKEKLMQLKSEYFNIPWKKIDAEDIPLNTLKFIPEDSARHYKIAPIAHRDDALEVGMVNPDNLEARDALQFISSKLNIPFKVFLISYADYASLLENYKGLSHEVTEVLSELETELDDREEQEGEAEGDFSFKYEKGNADIITNKEKKKAKRGQSHEEEKGEAGEEGDVSQKGKPLSPDTKINIVEDTPVTKIVATLLRHAAQTGSSDIHIEPTGEKIRVRFRIDGVLRTNVFLPHAVQNAVVARIKVLSNLKLDEKRKPQDGSFSAKIENRKIDFRVSTFPTQHGEKVVLRILDPEKGVSKLEETGLEGDNLEWVKEALSRPYGLVLLTGPTGSGKSTTLYGMLNLVDKEEKNAVSLEDPIEYNISGMSQSQVRPEIGYTFANGLRSILRQDPDIIMVGEIRDKETAQLAIQAALTGHLVFSTLHTNNAAGVVPRLVDMGVDPYLIAPTLLIAVGQRLVPTICEPSKKAVPIEGSIKEMITKQFEDASEALKKKIPNAKEVYEAVPSDECPGGTHGRTGVFEVMRINKAMEKVILENPTEGALLRQARENGMTTMKEDALFKSMQGRVPFIEVNKLEQ